MALVLNVSFTGDCKSIVVDLVGAMPNQAYTAQVTHVSSGTVFNGTIPASQDSYAFTGLDAGGLYKVEVRDSNGNSEKKFAVSTCAVDKCLVLLTDKLLACGCTDPACAAMLDKAQKVMLLIKSAEATAARIVAEDEEIFANDANLQYTKAVQMCEGNCDCGC